MNDGGPAFARPCGESNEFENDAQSGLKLRDYFAAKSEPLERLASSESVEALAGYSRPHDTVFDRFHKGIGSPKAPTREQWLDYFRWWADADAAMRYIRAEAMLAAREPKPAPDAGLPPEFRDIRPACGES